MPSSLIDVVHAVGQQLLPIFKNVFNYSRIPARKLGSVITRHKVYRIVLVFEMRAHIIQIFGSVEEMIVVALLAFEID